MRSRGLDYFVGEDLPQPGEQERNGNNTEESKQAGNAGKIRKNAGHRVYRKGSIPLAGEGCRRARRARHTVQGGMLVETRRSFVTAILVAAAASGWIGGSAFSQNPPVVPGRRPASEQGPPETPDVPTADKRMLDENQKEIKKKVERLFDLASELKTEVEKTDATTVLSIGMVKKAEEIEKLARQIKDRAKGG